MPAVARIGASGTRQRTALPRHLGAVEGAPATESREPKDEREPQNGRAPARSIVRSLRRSVLVAVSSLSSSFHGSPLKVVRVRGEIAAEAQLFGAPSQIQLPMVLISDDGIEPVFGMGVPEHRLTPVSFSIM